MFQEREMERGDIAELANANEALKQKIGGGEGGIVRERITVAMIERWQGERLEKLERERKEMKISIVEKDKEIEDLQFRLEEESILSQEREGEVGKMKEEIEAKKKELEKILGEKRSEGNEVWKYVEDIGEGNGFRLRMRSEMRWSRRMRRWLR